MNRIFGKKKAEAPHVNISDVGGRVEGRTTDLDMKVRCASRCCRCLVGKKALTLCLLLF